MKAFVANRCAKILLYSHKEDWRYVPTLQNPADLPSRGTLAKGLDQSITESGGKFWFNGPEFLTSGEEPEQPVIEPSREAETELRKALCDPNPFNRASKVTLRSKTQVDYPPADNIELLESEEKNKILNDVIDRILEEKKTDDRFQDLDLPSQRLWAENGLIKQAQSEVWGDAKKLLIKGEKLQTKHPLSLLSPVIDEDGLMRVHARLREVDKLDIDFRSPILLPKGSLLTEMIVIQRHESLDHQGGANALLSQLHDRFWIPRGRSLVKRVINDCVRCRYRRSRTALAEEAGLPGFRVPSERLASFSNTGVDAAGPWKVTRNRGTIKVWVVIFVCLGYKAVHVEVINELSTVSFLQAFQRFTARRGTPQTMLSDNGTNFVGASELLNKMLAANSEELSNANPTIEWRFNSPYSPHQGGIWERAVGVFKKTLKNTMSAAQFASPNLTEEEFFTLATVAEGYLNQRPLTAIPTEAEDWRALTPSSFIGGGALTDIRINPDKEPQGGGHRLASRYALLQRLLDHFWRRYIKEVVPLFNKKNKRWLNNRASLEEGDVVILLEEGARGRFPLGRVIKIITNKKDQIARNADILVFDLESKTRDTKVYRRSLTRLVVLLKQSELDDARVSEVPEFPKLPAMAD